MGRREYIEPGDFHRYLDRVQGERTEIELAEAIGMSRTTLRNLRLTNTIPKQETLSKFGLEMIFRTVQGFTLQPAIGDRRRRSTRERLASQQTLQKGRAKK